MQLSNTNKYLVYVGKLAPNTPCDDGRCHLSDFDITNVSDVMNLNNNRDRPKGTVQVKWKVRYEYSSYQRYQVRWSVLAPLVYIFYKDLVDELACHEGVISIDNLKFNVFC